MNIVDPAETFDRMKSAVAEELLRHMQVDGGKRSLRVSNVRSEDKLDVQDIPGQLDAKMRGATWGVPVVGDVELVENSTGRVLDRAKKVRLATVPKLTQRLSVIVDGTERIVRNQLRLRPGAYTVQSASGDVIKTQVNTSKGRNFFIHFDPRKADWAMEVGRAKRIPMWDVLAIMGVAKEQIEEALGKDVAETMASKSRGEWTAEQLYKTLMPMAPDVPDKAAAVRKYFEADAALSPDTTALTLGRPFTTANGPMMLAAVKKQLDISRGAADYDERDSLVFKQIQMLDDHLRNRLDAQLNKQKKNGRLWHAKARARIDRATNARDAVRRLDAGREIITFFNMADEGSLAESSGLTNPARQLDVYSQTTITGPGGTGLEMVTDLARSVHPSTLGILDPVHTPEGEKVGIDTHLTISARRTPDGGIGTEFINARTGAREVLTAAQASRKVIAFPDGYDLAGKKPRPLNRHEVPAVVRGKQQMAKPREVDHILPDGRAAFDTTLNMVPWLDSVDGARGVMASKMMGQALSLVDSEREAPIVQTEALSGKTFEREVALMHLPKSPSDGKVTKVTRDFVFVSDGKKTHRVGLYDHFPLQGKSGPMHHSTPTVKVGDSVKAGQPVAESNFTNGGVLALGKNLRVAFMSFKGMTFEDGQVISESAARKMTSQHLHQYQRLREPGVAFSKGTWKTQFPSLWKSRFDSMFDEDGIVKEGATVQPGDPIMLGSRRRTDDRGDQTARQIRTMLVHPFKNSAEVYDKDNVGVVRRVVKGPKQIEVHIYAEHPLQVGDKLCGRYGNKGIVSAVVPDSQMPHTDDGKPIDLIFDANGVLPRINPAQLLETAAAKVGRPFTVRNFSKGDNIAAVKAYLKKHNVSDTETVTDPGTGRRIAGITVGTQYIMKLEHEAETKAGARGIGPGYSTEERPSQAGGAHPQKIDHLTGYALLAHGARANLRDFSAMKATRNDEVWRAIANQEPIPMPKAPWVWGKFEAMLKQLGVNTVRHGDDLRIQPLTDSEVREMSAGEIKEAKFVAAQNIKPERGGLFDPIVTGGMDGTKWSHFNLVEAIPNPTFADSCALIAGITGPQFDGLVSGELGTKDGRVVPSAQAEHLRGAAFKDLLGRVDIARDLAAARADIRRTSDATKRNRLYRKIRVLQNLEHMNVSPEKAFMVSAVPVMPPIYRPVYPVPGSSSRTSPVNYLYKDAINLNNRLKELHAAGVPATLPDVQKGMTDLYQAVAAIQGYAEPLTKNKNYKGVMEQIAGSGSPKSGYFQSKLISKKQDLSGRGVLINAPELHVDEAGIPKEVAWEMFKPFGLAELVGIGYKPAQAMEEWKARTHAAERALDIAVSKRPIWINRAPSLHRHSIMAFKARVWNRNTIGLHPFVYKGLGADIDGDTLALHVPVTPAAVEESKQFFPSLHPFSVGGDLMTAPSKEVQWGLWSMTQAGKKTNREFAGIAEAAAAYGKQEISYTDLVKIGGRETTYGRCLANAALPTSMRNDSVVLDKPGVTALIKRVANEDPKALAAVLDAFKHLGYAAAYEMGQSITLDDITPMYARRDAILAEAGKDVAAKGVVEAHLPHVKRMQQMVVDHAPGRNLSSMIRSGAMGKKLHAAQQIVGAGVLYTDSKGRPVPVAVRSSFAEGLKPSEYFAAAYGARRGIIGRSLAVKKPGALAKDVAHTVMDMVVSKSDCGTDRGVEIQTEGLDLVGRYPARAIPGLSRDHAITHRDVEDLRKHGVVTVLARSPLTCLVGNGTCARCWGIDENGHLPKVGDNVGMRSGQAVTEPSVQLSLSAFHSGGVVGARQMREDLFDEARNLLDVPKNFRNKSTIARVSGKVEKIDKNPRGGHDIHVGGVSHYAPSRRAVRPGLLGRTVEVGEHLTDGTKDPRELAELTGLPNAQEYMADELMKTFAAGGVTQPRKHYETIIRAATGPVQVLDDPHGRHEVGQIVPFGVVEKENHAGAVVTEGSKAAGAMLLEKVRGHAHLNGKVLTEADAKALGGTRVKVNHKPIKYEPLFPGVTWAPQRREDWLARLAYRGLEKTLREGAAQGAVSKLHGLNPIPGWVVGARINPVPGPNGEY